MQNKDWVLKVEEHKDYGTCIHVIINDNVPIDNLVFRLLDEDRKPIAVTKVASREIYLCTSLAKPEFAELGDSVKYVEGSGKEFYKNTK